MNRLIRSLLVVFAAGHAIAQPAPWLRTNGPYGGDILSVAAGSAGLLFAAAAGQGGLTRIYRSSDSGASWSEIHAGVGIRLQGLLYSTPSGLLLSGATVTSGFGTARSTDGGDTWVFAAISSAVSGFGVDTAGNLLLASVAGGPYRSTDTGLTWTSILGDLTSGAATSVAVDHEGSVYIGDEGYGNGQGMGIDKSTDGGSHWTRVSAYSSAYVWALLATPAGSMLAGTQGGGILRSSNGGQSWPAANTGIPYLGVSLFSSDPSGTIFAATSQGVLKSTDDGLNWTHANKGLANLSVSSIASGTAGLLIAGTKINVFRSSDAGGSWTEAARGISSSLCTAIASNGIGTVITATGGGGGLYRTTDSGLTWLPANTGLTDKTILSLAAGGDGAFFAGVNADTDGAAVFRSTDQGATWAGLNTHTPGLPAWALATGSGGAVVAVSTSGNDGTGIYRSTDNGSTWSTLTTGLANVRFYSTTMTKSGGIYAGTWGGVYFSSDGGTSWTDFSYGLPYAPIGALASDTSGNLFAATGGFGTYELSGSVWRQIALGLPSYGEGSIVSLAVDSAGNVYGGSVGEGAYLLPSGSYKWQRYNTGLSDSAVTSICVAPSGLLYAGTNGDGVYRNGGTPLSSVLSNVSLPKTIQLMQNYPNPFNPSTAIEYVVPTAGEVTVGIYNILGQTVATIMDGRAEAGFHTIIWNAARYPSGVYFCDLRSGSIHLVKRMVLLK